MKSNKNKGASADHDLPQNPSRRHLLKNAGLVGAAMSAGAASQVIAADSPNAARQSTVAEQAGNPLMREALEVLTAEEAETLEAICDCLIPSDEHGPGAKEARAVHYIDRSLASHNSADRHDYMVSLAAINEYARSTRGKPYYDLIRDVQNSILLAVQQNKVPGCSPSASGFFNTVRSHTIDGTFCDPYYGGNQQFVGWDMIRYPGIRLSASETDVSRGAALEPNHQSAYDNRTYTKMVSNMSASEHGGDHNA